MHCPNKPIAYIKGSNGGNCVTVICHHLPLSLQISRIKGFSTIIPIFHLGANFTGSHINKADSHLTCIFSIKKILLEHQYCGIAADILKQGKMNSYSIA